MRALKTTKIKCKDGLLPLTKVESTNSPEVDERGSKGKDERNRTKKRMQMVRTHLRKQGQRGTAEKGRTVKTEEKNSKKRE